MQNNLSTDSSKEKTLDLRDLIEMNIYSAIDGVLMSASKTQNDYLSNRAKHTHVASQHIMKAFDDWLPELVDLKNKYETTPDGGIYVRLGTEDQEKQNADQVLYLAHFATDEGFNKGIELVRNRLKLLYKFDR